MIIKRKWLKKELEALETRKWYEEVPFLDEIYVISSRKKHASGYRLLNVYGIAYNDDGSQITYAKCISSSSDILDVRISPNVLPESRYSPIFSVDSLECGVMRYFNSCKEFSFEVGKELSTLEIKIVKNERK